MRGAICAIFMTIFTFPPQMQRAQFLAEQVPIRRIVAQCRRADETGSPARLSGAWRKRSLNGAELEQGPRYLSAKRGRRSLCFLSDSRVPLRFGSK